MGFGEAIEDRQKGLYLTAGDLSSEGILREKLLQIRRQKWLEFRKIQESDVKPERFSKYANLIYDGLIMENAVQAFLFARDYLTRILPKDFLPEMIQDHSEPLIVFEGAQGVLLDQDYGFQPYTTWSNCGFKNAEKLLDGFSGEIVKIGLVRAFPTRHGPGPFPSEANSFHRFLASDHNQTNDWQGPLRIGRFDIPLLNYAMEVGGRPDFLGISHLDQIDPSYPFQAVSSYDLDVQAWAVQAKRITDSAALYSYMACLTGKLEKALPSFHSYPNGIKPFLEKLPKQLGIKIGIQSVGKTFEHKTFNL
jgi:adenylosuccinate synthase